jgi:hypothetical protein
MRKLQMSDPCRPLRRLTPFMSFFPHGFPFRVRRAARLFMDAASGES